MALDKVIDSAKLDREMLATANAIREKRQTESKIPWEDETGYAQAVGAISTGIVLNFEVVGNSKPSNPEENTIWVDTDYEVTGWAFSAEEPSEPIGGTVWFVTGTHGNVEFNALKEDEIQVRPVSAKQYINGSWVDVPAQIYQGGKWVERFSGIYFVRAGVDNSSKWKYTTSGMGGGMSFSTDGTMDIYMATTNSSLGAVVFPYVHELQDLSGFSVLRAKIKCATSAGLTRLGIFTTSPPSSGAYKAKVDTRFTGAEQVITLPLDNISDGYPGIIFDGDINHAGQSAKVLEFAIE